MSRECSLARVGAGKTYNVGITESRLIVSPRAVQVFSGSDTKSAKLFAFDFAMTLIAASGCLTIRAPEEIHIGSNNRAHDTEQIPPTKNHEEARHELRRAYSEIRSLRRKVSHLEKDVRELKDDLREAKDDHDD